MMLEITGDLERSGLHGIVGEMLIGDVSKEVEMSGREARDFADFLKNGFCCNWKLRG